MKLKEEICGLVALPNGVMGNGLLAIFECNKILQSILIDWQNIHPRIHYSNIEISSLNMS